MSHWEAPDVCEGTEDAAVIVKHALDEMMRELAAREAAAGRATTSRDALDSGEREGGGGGRRLTRSWGAHEAATPSPVRRGGGTSGGGGGASGVVGGSGGGSVASAAAAAAAAADYPYMAEFLFKCMGLGVPEDLRCEAADAALRLVASSEAAAVAVLGAGGGGMSRNALASAGVCIAECAANGDMYSRMRAYAYPNAQEAARSRGCSRRDRRRVSRRAH